MFKVGVVGHGFVGKAVASGFKGEKDVLKKIIDPLYGNSVKDLKDFEPNIVFVAVPTPMSNDGSINSSIVESVVREIIEHTRAIIVIKSTVTPDIVSQLFNLSQHRVVYNPEFLTEANAAYDFLHPPMHILGGEKSVCMYVEKVYKDYTLCEPTVAYYMTPEEASFVKYGINSYLASKVLWMNQFYDIISKTNASYETISNAMKRDPRIGVSHMQVPGPDEKRGFGGACFPKDTLAFLNYSSDFSALALAITENNKYRNNYEKDQRELEQNVSYG